MSERQAKLKRKNEVVNAPVKKKSALDIVSNIIIVVLIIAVLGIGGWAVYSKYSQMPSNEAGQEVQTPTVAEMAQTDGITVEEYLGKYGISEVAEITPETPVTEIIPHMTLANYAAFSGTDVAQMKTSMGLSEEYSDDTLMSVIIDEIAATVQEQPENADEENQVEE